MKKTIILILMLFGACIIDSCCNNKDICFDIELASLKNFSLKGNYIINELETAKASNYAILLESSAIQKTCSINLSTGSSLYAYDCEEPVIIFKDRVNNISITSNADLNENYRAGSELKELFVPIGLFKHCLNTDDTSYNCLRNYFNYESTNTIEDAFNNLMAIDFYLNQNENRAYKTLSLFSLKTEEVIIENTHKIKIKFDFDSGKRIELITNDVIIN